MAKSDTTTQVNKPWKPQEGYYKDLYKSAQSAFDQVQGQPGYAGPTQTQWDANQQIIDLAPNLSQGSQELRDLATSQIRGDWLSPDTNPYIKDVVTAALRPVQQGFDQNLLRIGDQAILSGAYGGARQDLQQNRALDDFVRASGDISSGVYANNYANERQIQQNSGNLLDQANLLALAGPTALAGAGQQQQDWAQAALNDQLNSPWRGMSELASILGSGGFGTSTKTTPTNGFASMLQGLLGGASTGASLATGIGGVAAGAGLGAFAPWMLPFAALGGLAGAL